MPHCDAALTWPQVADDVALGLFILTGLVLVGWFFGSDR